MLLPATVPTPLSGVPSASGAGHRLLSVLQLLSNSLSFVSFMSLATVLLYPAMGDNLSAAEVLAEGSFGGGDSLESERCILSLPFLLTRLKFIRSLVSGGGDEWLLSDSAGSTLSESPSESREPLIGVGMMLMRFGGI